MRFYFFVGLDIMENKASKPTSHGIVKVRKLTFECAPNVQSSNFCGSFETDCVKLSPFIHIRDVVVIIYILLL